MALARNMLRPARPILQPSRMPEIQHVAHALASELQASLMDAQPATRLAKTTSRNRKLSGPLASPQRFVMDAGSNSHPAIAAGAHKVNARRLVNKTPGQTAGI